MSDAVRGSREDRRVTVTVDGTDIEAEPGELVIAAAERHGIYIPRFCYHQRMESGRHVPHVPRRGRHRPRPGAAAVRA